MASQQSPDSPPPNSLLVHVQFDARLVGNFGAFVARLEDKLCIYFQKDCVSKECDVKEVSLVRPDDDADHADGDGLWMNVSFSDPSGVQHSLEVESHEFVFDGQFFPLKVMQPPPQSPAVPSDSSLVSEIDEPSEVLNAAMQGCEMPPPYSPNDSSSTEEYQGSDDSSPDMFGVEKEFENQKPSNVIKSPQPQKRNNSGMGRGIIHIPITSEPHPGRDNCDFANVSNIPGESPGPSVLNASPPNQEQRKPRGPPNLAAGNAPLTSTQEKFPGSAARKFHKDSEPSTDSDSEEEQENESEKEEKVVMVVVSNFNMSTSDETLKLYFENNLKSGGGDIKTWERDAMTGTVIRITYENPSLAASVARRTHKLDGVYLAVNQVIKKPPRPRPVKKRCLFISGIPNGCSTEHLNGLFLESCSGLDKPNIQYGEMPGTAICTFPEKIPDVDKVIDEICSKKIQNVNLTAERVHESDSILVQGFSSGTTLDLIKLYFYSGGVREVEQGPADGQAVVYFEDWKVVADVLSTGKLHTFSGELLRVEEYHSSFGRMSPLDAPTPHIPKPASVQVPAEIMQFFFGKGENTKIELVNELKKVNAVLHWPDGSNKSSARLEPLEDQQCQSSWLKWPENSQKVLKYYLGRCKSEKIPIPPPFWKEVIDEVKQLDSKGYFIEEDAQRHTVHLAGEQGDVNKGSYDIYKIFCDLKAKAEFDAQQIKEDIPLQHMKLQQVFLCGIKDKMEKDFPGLKIGIQTSAGKRGLLLDGPRKDVQEAELFMRRQIDNLEQVEINTGKNKALFILNVSDKIHAMLGAQNILAMCSVIQDGRIMIYGAKKVDVTKARAYIGQAITETEIRVEGQAAISVLQNPEGRKLFDEINKQKFAHVELVSEAGRIELAGFKTALEEKKQKIVEFMKDNVILETFVPANKNTMIHINRFYGKEITYLMAKHTKNHVAIKWQMSDREGFVIQGNQEGVEGTSKAISQLAWGANEQQYPVSNGAFGGLPLVDDVPTAPAIMFTSAGPNKLLTNEGITITLKKGSITNETVDVLVNTAGPDMKLSNGAVAKAFLQAAGPALQQECDTVTASRGGQIPTGSFIETGAGALACKKIYHCVCLGYRKGESEQFLKKLVTSMMEQAEKSEMLSIAIPALGTGILNYPGDVAARVMYDAILDFSKRYPTGVLKDVRFVVYDKDVKTIKAFEDEIQRLITAVSRGAVDGPTVKTPIGGLPLVDDVPPAPVIIYTSAGPNILLTYESIMITLKKGSIANETVDVLVNTAGPDMKLSNGAVAKAFLQAAGPALQQECDTVTASRGGRIPTGSFIETGAGALACKKIYHCVCLGYRQGKSEQFLKKLVTSMMEQAEKSEMLSIAIPALGTGNLNYPGDVAARVMCEAILDFSKRYPTGVLKDVRFVVYDKDVEMIKAFVDEFQRLITGVSSEATEEAASNSNTPSIIHDSDIMNLIPMDRGHSKLSTDLAISTSSTLSGGTSQDVFQEQKEETEARHRKHLFKWIMPDTFGLIEEMSEEHIKYIEKKNNVDIKIYYQDRGNVMRVKGCVLDVKNAQIEIQELFTQMLRDKTVAQRRELLSKQVQWKYTTPNGMEPYKPEVNALIEEAHAQKQASVQLSSREEGRVTTVIFQTMQEISTHSLLVVQRVDLLKDFKAPSNWDPMTGNTNFAMATLKAGSEEYINVQTQFNLSMVGLYIQINEIQRVQTKHLMMQYQARKTAMEAGLARTNVEMSLFHGTDEQTCDKINKRGFNRSYGKNAKYGNGTYFAAIASYSARDVYAKPNANGIRHMYLAKVLVGDYTRGSQGMIDSPVKPGSPDQHYDSVVDNTDTPVIYVIIQDAQTYPEYLIKFQ